MSEAGNVTADVRAADKSKDLKLRRIVDLQQEIASEEASITLMEERTQEIRNRVQGLKAQLDAAQNA